MVVNSKDFIKFDAGILAVNVLYYLIEQFRINEGYSSGYYGIWVYFTLENCM